MSAAPFSHCVAVFSVGERKLPLCGFFTLQTIYMHKILHNTVKERPKPKKHNMTLLNFLLLALLQHRSEVL